MIVEMTQEPAKNLSLPPKVPDTEPELARAITLLGNRVQGELGKKAYSELLVKSPPLGISKNIDKDHLHPRNSVIGFDYG